MKTCVHTIAHSTDVKPPVIEYQEIMFQAIEMSISLEYQLRLISEAFGSTNWTGIREVKVLPEIMNKTSRVLDRVNRTLDRRMNLGFHEDSELEYCIRTSSSLHDCSKSAQHFCTVYFLLPLAEDRSDPIDKATVTELIECFNEMKKYVDRFQAERGYEDRDLRKAAIEMRLQINTAVQELEATGPDLHERMRMIRGRVTQKPRY